MITQRLILINPPEGTISLDVTDGIWACAGCRATIEGYVISHRDDCPQIASIIDAAVRARARSILDEAP